MAKLRIAEIFASIQGEGQWLGIPSTFVRVSGCNLRCVWCDTPYASWRPEGPVMEVSEVVERVKELGVRHVVLTGGEPMLFDGIEDLSSSLKALGHIITVETAGTVYRELPCDLMSISPKLANSTPVGLPEEGAHERIRLDRAPLGSLLASYNYQLKFVVVPGDSLVEIRSILAQFNVPAERVMLMAEGTEAESLRSKERLLAGVCVREGWRLTPRLHIELFGNTRRT